MDGVETYPGSQQPLRSAQRRMDALVGTEDWDVDQFRQRLVYRGQPTDFFTIGALAVALGRQPGTIRDWEDMGYLPRAPRRTDSDDRRHGKRRLYTREEILGLKQIAEAEGLFERTERNVFRARVADTGFPAKARQLFDELKGD